MSDSRALDSNDAGRLPIEVCENVIDMLYSVVLRDQVEHTRALHSCALVCRAWRIRSQRNLFYSVVLHGAEAVRRLAAALDNGPHLSDYVCEVILIGRTLHTTTNPLSIFPISLHGKLPRLERMFMHRVRSGEDWCPTTSGLGTAKCLEYLPLHPRFPLLLSVFTTVTSLLISGITFLHFKDLAEMANTLPSLQELTCASVCCKMLCPLPKYMKQRTDVGGHHVRQFSPKLQELVLVCPLQRL